MRRTDIALVEITDRSQIDAAASKLVDALFADSRSEILEETVRNLMARHSFISYSNALGCAQAILSTDAKQASITDKLGGG